MDIGRIAGPVWSLDGPESPGHYLLGLYVNVQKIKILLKVKSIKQFDIERDCRHGSEYSFEPENSMEDMLIKSLNDKHLNQHHDYQYHIFAEQNTKNKSNESRRL